MNWICHCRYQMSISTLQLNFSGMSISISTAVGTIPLKVDIDAANVCYGTLVLNIQTPAKAHVPKLTIPVKNDDGPSTYRMPEQSSDFDPAN